MERKGNEGGKEGGCEGGKEGGMTVHTGVGG